MGVGMIGASLAVALRRTGWHVTGWDSDAQRLQTALSMGAVDAAGTDEQASISFVCTPVSAVAEVASRLLAFGGVVTDVASVKAPVVQSIEHPNFVGGHPMAGSEKTGPEAASDTLFEGASWVLTPTSNTSAGAMEAVASTVAELGARVLQLDAHDHDAMVATISHVPHLVSSALMALAHENAGGRPALMNLAAGGFRDMTRIAAGRADLWADIAVSNRVAIVEELDRLTLNLREMRDLIAKAESQRLCAALESAAVARRELPPRGRPAELAVLRVVVPDEPGVLARVLTILGDLQVNVEDFELTHDSSNTRGYLELTIGASSLEATRSQLVSSGFIVGSEAL